MVSNQVLKLGRFDPESFWQVASSGCCPVGVWGAVSKGGLGPLLRHEGRFNAAGYEELVETVLLPYALEGPFPDGLLYFQHDRSPIHIARCVTALLQEKAVAVIEWPSKGADMNV